MFKSLRRKFIATAVGSVAVVIAILAIALNFINFYKLEERIDTTLLDASKSQALIKIFAEEGDDLVITKNSSSSTEYNGFSIAKIDNNGRIIKAYRDDSLIPDQDALQSKVIEALEKGKTSGFIGSYRFIKVDTSVGNLILFLNCQRELDSYESFVQNSILISIGVIISVLVLIILVSKRVIAPIQDTYIKQKQFITGASHELKTPLAIISSNADVLEMMNGDSKWTQNIHNQVDRLSSLVNSLVVFSRMEEKDTVERTHFDLTEALKLRIEDFDELANFQKKNIVADVDSNLKYYGEKDSIIQLMDILLENAIKYAPFTASLEFAATLPSAMLDKVVGTVVSPLPFTTRACGFSTTFGALPLFSSAVFTVPSAFTSSAIISIVCIGAIVGVFPCPKRSIHNIL